jgi:hypothetical protein
MKTYQIVEMVIGSGAKKLVASRVFATSEAEAVTCFYRCMGEAWVRSNLHKGHRAETIA